MSSPPTLTVGRVHDACGAGARAFAVLRAAEGVGPVVWVDGRRRQATLNPRGLAARLDPARLVFVRAPGDRDALWCMEAALRSGAAPLVVGELSRPADLTESRRLLLAAKGGGGTGLCLIPDAPVSNAAETRWRCAPLPGAMESTPQRWELIKNKEGTFGLWDVDWDDSAHRVVVVSASGGGMGSAPDGRRPGAPVRDGRDAAERVAALLAERGRGGGGAAGPDGAG
jgi:protein ImuA